MRTNIMQISLSFICAISFGVTGCANRVVVSPPSVPQVVTTASTQLAYNKGKFSAVVNDGTSQTEMTVNCTQGRDGCDLSIRAVTPKLGNWEAMPKKPLSTRSLLLFANSELAGARAALRNNPRLWETSMHGDLLKSARPVVEGDAKFTRCSDTGAVDTEMMVLCEYQASVATKPMTVLLMTTMLPTCGSSVVMCQKYFIPLRREP